MLYSRVSTFWHVFILFIFIFKFNHNILHLWSRESRDVMSEVSSSCLVVLKCWCWSSDSEAAEKLSGGHDQRHHSEADWNWPLTGLVTGFTRCIITRTATTVRTAGLVNVAYGFLIAQIGLAEALGAISDVSVETVSRFHKVIDAFPALLCSRLAPTYDIFCFTVYLLSVHHCKRQTQSSLISEPDSFTFVQQSKSNQWRRHRYGHYGHGQWP